MNIEDYKRITRWMNDYVEDKKLSPNFRITYYRSRKIIISPLVFDRATKELIPNHLTEDTYHCNKEDYYRLISHLRKQVANDTLKDVYVELMELV